MLDSAFYNSAAHEMKSPLTTIKLFAQVLEDQRMSPDKRRDYLHKIDTKVDSLVSLIDNMVDILNFDSHRLKLRSELIPIQTKLPLLFIQIRRLNPDLVPVIKPLPPVSVKYDPSRFRQLFFDLTHIFLKIRPHTRKVYLESRLRDNFFLLNYSSCPDYQFIDPRFSYDRLAPPSSDLNRSINIVLHQKLITAFGGHSQFYLFPQSYCQFSLALPTGS